MIAVDSSSMIAYFAGSKGGDVSLIDQALQTVSLALPPVVLSELLSDHRMPKSLKAILLEMPVLSVSEFFWQHAGLLRAKALAKGYKSRLADVLICQSCVEHKVPLLTRDRDFRHYVPLGGLQLIKF